jgi:hypothetical protein
MTDPHVHEPGHGHDLAHGQVRAEEDRVHTPVVVGVGVASLLVFLLAGAAAVGYLRMRQGQHPPIVIPPEAGQSKIGMVEQDLFDVAVRGEQDATRRKAKLGRYGWVDREKGIVHLPIDRAMELVAQGVRPGPKPGTPPVTPGAQP